MKHSILKHRGNILEVNFTVTIDSTRKSSREVQNSCTFVLGGAVVFQARIVSDCSKGYCSSSDKYARFFKQYPDTDNNNYTINLKVYNLGQIINKCLTCDDGTWHLFHEDNGFANLTFSVLIEIDFAAASKNLFLPLYDNEVLTDFELRGEGGAIRIHKAVLANASPVFLQMFSGSWKETVEGYIAVKETSKDTLQSLKDYVYLNTIPTTGLEQLMLLAMYYDMPELEQKCVNKLMQNLEEQDAYHYIEFAVKNKMTRLVLAILDAVKEGEFKIKEIRKQELYLKFNTDPNSNSTSAN